MAADVWRIQLLGGLRATRGAWALGRFPTQKTAALLATLAFRPGREHARDALLELLWPGAEPHLGRNNLSKALSALRHALEPPGVEPGAVIAAHRAGISLLSSAVETDVAAFEAALARGDGAGAIALYEGDLLPGHGEEWVEPERARLRAMFVGAALAAAGESARAGDLPGAMALARRACAADPLSERAQGELLELLAKAGDAAAAIAAFAEFAGRLSKELGATPGRALRERAEAIAKRAGVFAAPAVPSKKTAARAESPRGEHEHEREHEQEKRPEAAPALPLELTAFVGREAEVVGLETMIAQGARLVTLVGPGGIGKTRLSIEAARRLESGFPGRVYFAPLADVTDAAAIPIAILAALRIAPKAGEAPLERAAEALAAKPSVLVLDNLEHLVDAAAPLVKTLLERAPTLRCLATSRRRLGLQGEQELPVTPFDVPEDGERDPARLAALPIVRMLVDRARAVRPDFAIDARSAPAVAALCRRLDGIPLGIALAAGRLQVLSVEELLSRIEKSLEILSSRQRDLPARHRTMRAAVAWSVEMLAPDVRRFFASLAVFRGGFDLEAVEAVEAVSGDALALDRVSDLRECSLLLVDESAGATRFRLLEPVREAASDLVPEEGRERLARRHAEYFTTLAEAAAARLSGAEQARTLVRLDAEAANLHGALAWTLEDRGRAALGLRLAANLSYYWLIRGRHAEARLSLEKLLAAAPAPETDADRRARAEGLRAAARVAGSSGDNTAAPPLIEEALEIYARLGDRRWEGRLATALGAFLRNRGEVDRARALLARGIAAARADGDAREIANALFHQGVLVHIDSAAAAQAAFAEAADLCRSSADPFLLAVVLSHLAMARADGGDRRGARAVLAEAIEIARGVSAAAESRALMASAFVAADEGALAEARRAYDETLSRAEKNGEHHVEAAALLGLARIDLRERALAAARPRLERALGLFRDMPFPPGIAFCLLARGEIERGAGDLAGARRTLREAIGHAAVATGPGAPLAAALEALATLAVDEGDAARAARLVSGAAALRERIGVPVPPLETADHAALAARLSTLLGAAPLAEAMAAGSALSRAELVALAQG